MLSGEVSLSGLTIRGGLTDSNVPGGAGVRVESGAQVTLSSVVIRHNESREDGGGLENAGTLVVRDSIVVANSASDVGGGIASGERGLSPEATVLVERSTIAENASTAGGGGLATHGPLRLRESTVSGNVDGGGAILVGSGGGFVAENSTVSGNDEVGLLVLAGQADVVSSTFFGNKGDGDGVGISDESDPADDTVRVRVTGSIIADGCLGNFDSGGGNVDAEGSCAFDEPNDQSGVDPRLGPLIENGGSTQTHAPLEDSPALDSAGPSGLPSDQRGVSRPQGDAFDSGAVELAVSP